MTKKEFVTNACLAIIGGSRILDYSQFYLENRLAIDVVCSVLHIADKLEEREYFDD
jgi:hypothetical protein